MKKLFLPLLSFFILTSCEEVFEKTIDYEIPQEPSKLTIDAKLIDGSPVDAFVSTSEYSMGNTSPKLDSGATVNLYENGIFKERLRPLDNGYYQGMYRTQAGNSYKVEAVRQGYATAFGNNEIKQPVPVASGKFSVEQEEYKLEVSFNDPPGQGDYYYFYVSLVAQDYSNDRILFHTLDPSVEVFDTYDDPFDQEQGTYGEAGYLSDQYFDGRTKRLELNSGGYFFPGPIDTSLRVRFTLYHISKDLYQHEKTKAAYQLKGDGLFSEPVQVYTNIINGYGIVAGTSRSFIEIKP